MDKEPSHGPTHGRHVFHVLLNIDVQEKNLTCPTWINTVDAILGWPFNSSDNSIDPSPLASIDIMCKEVSSELYEHCGHKLPCPAHFALVICERVKETGFKCPQSTWKIVEEHTSGLCSDCLWERATGERVPWRKIRWRRLAA